MTRGEIWWADLGLPFESEPGFNRPVLILQDNSFNKSKFLTTVVLSISTNMLLAEAPGDACGLIIVLSNILVYEIHK